MTSEVDRVMQGAIDGAVYGGIVGALRGARVELAPVMARPRAA